MENVGISVWDMIKQYIFVEKVPSKSEEKEFLPLDSIDTAVDLPEDRPNVIDALVTDVKPKANDKIKKSPIEYFVNLVNSAYSKSLSKVKKAYKSFKEKGKEGGQKFLDYGKQAKIKILDWYFGLRELLRVSLCAQPEASCSSCVV